MQLVASCVLHFPRFKKETSSHSNMGLPTLPLPLISLSLLYHEYPSLPYLNLVSHPLPLSSLPLLPRIPGFTISQPSLTPLPLPLRCRSGKCIARESLCDGVFRDCAEGEDELFEFCKTINVCSPGRSFKCDYGICLPEQMVCDGNIQCLDATDELVCVRKPCPADRPFKCLSGLCISMDQVYTT